jgi:Lrp/AsnC family leucine-responsive transcriptional regulator
LSSTTKLRPRVLDEDDLRILRLLQEDARVTREQMARKLKLSKSAVQYRIKKLENSKIIEGYYAKINPSKMGKEYEAITLVRAKYSPSYYAKLGQKLASLRGVWAVYYTFGDNDFILLMRGIDREDLLATIEEMTKLRGIERTASQIVIKTIKEDPRLEL